MLGPVPSVMPASTMIWHMPLEARPGYGLAAAPAPQSGCAVASDPRHLRDPRYSTSPAEDRICRAPSAPPGHLGPAPQASAPASPARQSDLSPALSMRTFITRIPPVHRNGPSNSPSPISGSAVRPMSSSMPAAADALRERCRPCGGLQPIRTVNPGQPACGVRHQ